MTNKDEKLKACQECDGTGIVYIAETIGGEFTRTVYPQRCECQTLGNSINVKPDGSVDLVGEQYKALGQVNIPKREDMGFKMQRPPVAPLGEDVDAHGWPKTPKDDKALITKPALDWWWLEHKLATKRAVIRGLEARLHLAQSQWRPISECPRIHGKRFLGWSQDIGEFVAEWFTDKWVYTWNQEACPVTKWYPLPSPPAAE